MGLPIVFDDMTFAQERWAYVLEQDGAGGFGVYSFGDGDIRISGTISQPGDIVTLTVGDETYSLVASQFDDEDYIVLNGTEGFTPILLSLVDLPRDDPFAITFTETNLGDFDPDPSIAPIAYDDVLTVSQRNEIGLGDVLTDGTPDRDPDDGTLRVTKVAIGDVEYSLAGGGAVITGTYGTLRIAGIGRYTYSASTEGTVAVGGSLTEVFTYTIADSDGIEDTARLSITIIGSSQGDGLDNIFYLTGPGTSAAGAGGNDLYYVDNAADIVIEQAGQGTVDQIITNTSYALGATAEIELLTVAVLGGNAPINLTGNAFAQTIMGNYGANTLRGGGGSDVLQGLAGDDTYVVDSADDVVLEFASQGIDTVVTSVSLTLGANLENIVAEAGTGRINLTGNNLANVLTGNAGNNILDGGLGPDTMHGGGGSDTFLVDNGRDVVVELVGGGTGDTVVTTGSYALAAAAEIENLRTASPTGVTTVNLTGNTFAQTIQGNDGANVIRGGGGIDRLEGRGGNDTYYVDSADDVVLEALDSGTDTVIASASYALSASASIETLRTTSDAGRAAIDLAGNRYDQAITGNAGANVLAGGGGIDTLSGLGGNDRFRFDSPLAGRYNLDTIVGFSNVAGDDDRFDLDDAVFKGILADGSGRIGEAYFKNLAAGAVDADDRIVYDQAAGKIYYDSNGSDAGGRVQFAQVDPGTVLTSADFFIF